MEVFVWLLSIGARPYQKMSTGKSYLKAIPAATVTFSPVLKSRYSRKAYVEALKAFSLQNVVPNSRVLVKIQVVHALTRHASRLQQSVFEGPYKSLDIYFDPWFIVLEVDLFSFLRVQLGMLEVDSWQQGRLDNWPASSTTYHAKPIRVQVRSNTFAFQWDGLDQMTANSMMNLPKLSQFCRGYGTRRFWTESDFGPAMKDEVNKWTETMPHFFSPIEYLKQQGSDFRESWNKEELYYQHSLRYHRKLELEVIQKPTSSGRDE
ncbi:hypothetical protein BS50DRAFT_314105 [Corynespora cassiicola Philippines]|uniref:Uncharacterized protein n=1 Tax=Corynespora cassiicola Philippines TaxID=1448308 RepID=A0A2T2NYG6_CORCC|nr:hypothetical protein BS50DRAFT_314105 [Corynespora cassiicola Philippines]